jgi:hypothetical protein
MEIIKSNRIHIWKYHFVATHLQPEIICKNFFDIYEWFLIFHLWFPSKLPVLKLIWMKNSSMYFCQTYKTAAIESLHGDPFFWPSLPDR